MITYDFTVTQAQISEREFHLKRFSRVVVSTGSIRWILWFSVRYAAAAARREIFGVNALGGKQQQLGSPNLQDIFIGG